MITSTMIKRFIPFLLAVMLVLMIPLEGIASGKGTVNTSSLILRKSDSKSSKALQTLNRGTELTILDTKGDWYKVSYGKYTGYVMKKYVSAGSSSGKSSGATSGSSTSGKSKTSSAKSISSIGKAPSATKKGDKGTNVKKLQQALKLLGYYTGTVDGDYGNGTASAVKKFQKKSGLKQTGEANSATISKLWSSKASTSSSSLTTERLNWFNGGADVIPKGATFTVKDCKTGKTFKVKRWSGGNHLDAEPLTSGDTATAKSVYGHFSWKRRAILVKYNGHVYAASMNYYPHGTQTITNNNFDGHFCIHFYKSKTHGTNKVDKTHQNCVSTAMKYSW